jgi:NAD(P)-dependent dehydrogenase (short-subunit alcohol dehydrogenase family)
MMSSTNQESAGTRSVLVTGGSRGLGRCFVTAFSMAGYDVYFTYQNNQGQGAALVDELRAEGGKATALELDVRDARQVQDVVSEAERLSGGLGVLVNNAGVSHDGMSWKLAADDWRDTLDVNLTGAFLMSQAVLPGMRERKHGRIVNISSVVGSRGIAGTAAYSSSKAALSGMTRTIAREVASRNITVNCLVLGYYNSGMGTKLPPDFLEQTLRAIPAGRLGNPEELASIVLFLCSDACGYLTGQEIVVDGGFLIA